MAMAFIRVDEGAEAATTPMTSSAGSEDGPAPDSLAQIEQCFIKSAAHLKTIRTQTTVQNNASDPTTHKQTYLSFDINDCNQVRKLVFDDRASASTASGQQRANLAINSNTDLGRLIRSQG